MLDTIAYDWMTAGGSNDPEQVTHMLLGSRIDASAKECIECWGLDTVDMTGEPGDQTHMEANGYSTADMLDAFVRFALGRPDIERPA